MPSDHRSHRRNNQKIKREHSAGGIVYKLEDGLIQIAIAYREYHHDWTLPKGHLEPGETSQEAALREVEEEVGLIGRIEHLVGHNVYRFRNKDKQLIEKKVDYYLMSLERDKRKIQVEEIDQVKWLPFLDAIKKLTFKADKDLVKQAVSMIRTS